MVTEWLPDGYWLVTGWTPCLLNGDWMDTEWLLGGPHGCPIWMDTGWLLDGPHGYWMGPMVACGILSLVCGLWFFHVVFGSWLFVLTQ